MFKKILFNFILISTILLNFNYALAEELTLTKSLSQYKNDKKTSAKIAVQDFSNPDFVNAKKKELSSLITVLQSYLSGQKTQLDQLQSYSVSEKEILNRILEDGKNVLSAQNLKIQTAQENKDLSNIAKDINKAWLKTLSSYRKISGELISDKFSTALENIKLQITELNNNIYTLKQKNKDTTRLDSLLSDINSKITEFQSSNEQAKKIFSSITEKTPIDQNFNDGLSIQEQCQRNLIDIWQTLGTINSELEKSSS